MARMTNKEFIEYFMKNINAKHLAGNLYEFKNLDKYVKVIITPMNGWKYELHYEVTEILHEDDVTFVSNAFAFVNEAPDMNANITVKEFIDNFNNEFTECVSSKEHPIIFEVYGLNGEKINNQIVITYIEDPSRISITEDDKYVYINVKTDDIATLS